MYGVLTPDIHLYTGGQFHRYFYGICNYCVEKYHFDFLFFNKIMSLLLQKFITVIIYSVLINTAMNFLQTVIAMIFPMRNNSF